MKLAVTGKGGVGKTTLTSLLAFSYAARGDTVMAIDADPSPCLGAALGFPAESLKGIRPIAEMEELILERTGAQKGTYGGYFKINPRTDDIPDRFSALYRGIRLLELGAVETGHDGCICPESVLLKALVSHILLYRNEVVLLDMYAGVEHLSRATTDAVDVLLIVAEPTARSLNTAAQIRDLAGGLKLQRVYLVGSKVENQADRDFIAQNSPGLEVVGYISADPAVREADRTGKPIYDLAPKLAAETVEIVAALDQIMEKA
ncbi:MAG: AAA family ATPase [Chloroflexota bacterium]|nr:AAA family ATPase [Chloroflexota bacterium]